MVDLTEISAVVAAAGVLVGVVYYILEIRQQTKASQDMAKTTQADLAIRINPWLNMSGVEFQQVTLKLGALEYRDYDDFVKKYGSIMSESSASMAFHAASNFSKGWAFF